MPLSPAVARWELARRLRQRRLELGIGAAALTRQLDVSAAYWSHIENERNLVPEDKLEQLLVILEIDESEQHELLALRDAARQRGWWAAHPGLFDEELTRYYGMEWGAHTIRSYESVMMPGLLQGEEFVRALMNSRGATVAPVEAEERVRARLTRQRRLTDAEDPLHLTVVLGEAVLHQQLGGPEVLGRQLRHLVAMAEAYPATIDIRVIPFADAGFVPAGSTFHLLDFDRPRLPTLAWYESAVFGETVVDDPARNQNRVRDLTYLFERMHRERGARAGRIACPDPGSGRGAGGWAMSGWFVSSYSSDRQTCVEVRFRAGRVDVRDSKSAESPILSWSAGEWRAFTAAIRAGALR